MSNRLQSLFSDTRNHFRINDQRRVFWKIKEGVQQGKATIRNVSATGMMIETNGTFVPPKDGCIFTFDSTLGHDNYIPQYGELVWSKKIGRIKNKFHCGVRFFEPADYVQTKLRQRIQKGILRITLTKRTVKGLSVVLTLGIVALTGYALWISQDVYEGLSTSVKRFITVSDQQAALTRNYKDLYNVTQTELARVTQELNATKQLYQESQDQLGSVNQELSETKMILAQTEALLIQARSGADQLTADFQTTLSQNETAFADLKAKLESDIAALQQKNATLEREVGTLQEQLNFYEGNVKNIDEGYVLLNIFKERMKVVKGKIKSYKKDVRELHRRAQNERDRIQLQIGNNGYLMKNGAPVQVDMEKYNAAASAPAVVTTPIEGLAPNVEINVTNFE